MTDWLMKGPYMKNCNCDPGCPCDFNAAPTHTKCEGMAGMIVEEGHFGDVSLDGSKWVFKYYWPGPLHEGNGTGQAILDSATTDEQREALGAILSGQNGGTFFGILAEIITTFHDPIVADIDMAIDVDGRMAHCRVPGVVETDSHPIGVIGVDEPQPYRVQIAIPNGFEYDLAEIAQSKVLEGHGDIAFSAAGSHSSLAQVARHPGN